MVDKIRVNLSRNFQSEARQLQRIASLMCDGFTDGEIEVLKWHRITPCKVTANDGSRYRSSVVYNLRRRRRTQVARLARELGLDPKDKDQFDIAAQEYRDRGNKSVNRWKEETGYAGLPPEYDPTVLMGYAKYA